MRGADKLLEPLDGAPIVRVLVERALLADMSVRVMVPDVEHPRALAVKDLPVEVSDVPDCSDGMAASIRRGIVGLTAHSVIVLPADMPEITAEDLRAVATAEGSIVQATSSDGTPGHPVKFDQRFYAELSELSADIGAKPILKRHAANVVRVALPGNHATTDLDTPEEWAAWRAGQAAHKAL
ncbi:MAG: nucleotidyltransferase family protein [Marinovum sp.]|nr:nucleotidyltransferase family protein [Marinovum sp.]